MSVLLSIETFRENFSIQVKEFSRKSVTQSQETLGGVPSMSAYCDITYTISTLSEPTLSKDFIVHGGIIPDHVQSASDYFLCLYFWTQINYEVMVWATDVYEATLHHGPIIGSMLTNSHLCFGDDYGSYGDETGTCPYRGTL